MGHAYHMNKQSDTHMHIYIGVCLCGLLACAHAFHKYMQHKRTFMFALSGYVSCAAAKRAPGAGGAWGRGQLEGAATCI